MKSDYVLVSRWTIGRSREALWEVVDELLATDDPVVWWPSVQVMDYADGNLRLRAASGLGYAVRFTLSGLEKARPDLLTFDAQGDLRGRGVVRFVELGPGSCAMDIDWRVAADRRWMRWSGWLLRPIFVLGHGLVMRRGERNLNQWLLQR